MCQKDVSYTCSDTVNIIWCKANQNGFRAITEFLIMDFSLKRVMSIHLKVVKTKMERLRLPMCEYCAASTIASNSDKSLNASEATIYFVAFFVLVFISFHLFRGSNKSTELDKLEEWSKKREAINI